MKHLFNNISQDEKQRILEMHKGTKMVFSEQAAPTQTKQKELYIDGVQLHDGYNWKIDDPKAQPYIEKIKINANLAPNLMKSGWEKPLYSWALLTVDKGGINLGKKKDKPSEDDIRALTSTPKTTSPQV